jgi:hypothetical protein
VNSMPIAYGVQGLEFVMSSMPTAYGLIIRPFFTLYAIRMLRSSRVRDLLESQGPILILGHN